MRKRFHFVSSVLFAMTSSVARFPRRTCLAAVHSSVGKQSFTKCTEQTLLQSLRTLHNSRSIIFISTEQTLGSYRSEVLRIRETDRKQETGEGEPKTREEKK